MEQISSIATDKRPNTYKITFKKIARAAAAETRVHKKLAIIAYVLYGVAFLLFIFNADIYEYKYAGSAILRVSFDPSPWGTSFAVFGVFTSLFTVLNVFRDTGNQQLCDVSMTLPIKASERFLSKLLCLVYIQIAPFTVSVLGGNGIATLIGTLQFHGRLESETPQLIFSLFFMGLASLLFIMAIATLCACCCGAPAESAYFSFIMMFIINGLPVAIIMNILNRCSGFNDAWYGFFDYTSNVDLGYWGFLFFLNLKYDYVISHAAVGCGISIVVMLLSGLIYKKRDARSVGTPISSKLFFEIMMAGSCSTVFALTVMNSAYLWGILIAGVAYIIINIIVSRAKINGLSFVKWIGKFALTTAAFTAIVIASIKTGGFGYYRLRPNAGYLEGASFRIELRQYNNTAHRQSTLLYTYDLTAQQADELMKLCKKHIQKGIAKVNPFPIILDGRSDSTIYMKVTSDVTFLNQPSPKFMFYFNNYSNIMREGYYLDYYQQMYISNSEATALANELKQLDYVHEEDRSDPYYIYD